MVNTLAGGPSGWLCTPLLTHRLGRRLLT